MTLSGAGGRAQQELQAQVPEREQRQEFAQLAPGPMRRAAGATGTARCRAEPPELHVFPRDAAAGKARPTYLMRCGAHDLGNALLQPGNQSTLHPYCKRRFLGQAQLPAQSRRQPQAELTAGAVWSGVLRRTNPADFFPLSDEKCVCLVNFPLEQAQARRLWRRRWAAVLRGCGCWV